MLVLDVEHNDEVLNLDQLLRDLWKKLRSRLGRKSAAKAQVEEDSDKLDLSGSLIL